MSDAPLAAFFDRVPVEADYEVTRVEGEVPSFLRGTYYLNGPARFRRGPARWKHWLDGDGMVSALTFGDRGAGSPGARYRNRFVVSDKLRREAEAGRPLYRAFGTAFEDDALEGGVGLESPVNVSIFPFVGRLLAFGEQGLPWELDADTLATLGEFDFGRTLKSVSPFAAHPSIDPATGEMFNFGISFSPASPKLFLYRLDAAGSLVYRRHFPLDHPISVHDFGLSRRWAVFYLAPYVLDLDRVVRDGATLLEALGWRPDLGSELRWIDRATGAQCGRAEIGNGYCLHLVGAFDDDDRLVVDVLEMDRPVYDQYDVPELFPDARVATPVRYVVSPDGDEVLGRRELDFHAMCDFPQVDPRRIATDYGEFWMLAMSDSDRPGTKFFDQLVHADWSTGAIETYTAPPGTLLAGEPVCAPDPAPREPGQRGRRAVLCQELEPGGPASAVLVFDAAAVAAGPVARLRLEHPVPPSFHGVWLPEGGRAAPWK